MITLPIHKAFRSDTQSSQGNTPLRAKSPAIQLPAASVIVCAGLGFALLLLAAFPGLAAAQDDPLNKVHVPVPPAAATPATGAPTGAEAPAVTGNAGLKVAPGGRLAMNVDLVLVPVTITDPMNRLVTGLEQNDFFIYENNSQQKLKTFSCEDAPVSIGIIFDLSGSMTTKLIRARDSILQFMKTANPQDEFLDRKSTRLNSSHLRTSRMPSSA